MADRDDAPERKPIICAHITNPKDMADMFLSLDRLRDGDYARRWHDFPTTKEEIQDTLKIIRIDSEKHSEYYINEFESSIPGLAERLQAGADIDELNYLAVKLAGMDEYELEKFCAAMEYSVFRDGLTDIINTAENLDCFELQPAYNAEQYGEFLVEVDKDNTSPVFDKLEHSANPEERALAQYILRLEASVDAAAYGRAAAEEEKGVFTGHGYLTKQKALDETYTGINDIPPEHRVFAYPEREPAARPSVMDKLAAAKEAVARTDAEKPPADRTAPQKSHDAEL
jgi:hypothetical protein